MIKAKIGDLVLLGLEEENIKRLKDDQPIVLDLAVFGLEGKLVLMYGETQAAVVEKLEAFTGVSLQQTYRAAFDIYKTPDNPPL